MAGLIRICSPLGALLACLLLGFSAGAYADLQSDIENCDGCHGPDGASSESDMPGIGGISALIIEEYMLEFLDEARPCRESEYRYGDTSRPATDMCAVAASLDEDRITALADYYAGKPFVPAVQDFDAAKAEEGRGIHRRDCEKCHSDGGSYQGDDAGRLAGQWMPYLEMVFDDYASGKRPIWEEKMQEKIEALDAASVEALIHYYASMQ